MAKRYYIVQWCDRQRGWTDVPHTESVREHECIREMTTLTESEPHKAMRVWRKPHGWEPDLGPVVATEETVPAWVPVWPKDVPQYVEDLPREMKLAIFSCYTRDWKPSLVDAVKNGAQRYWTTMVQALMQIENVTTLDDIYEHVVWKLSDSRREYLRIWNANIDE